jgi:hypothetical protein
MGYTELHPDNSACNTQLYIPFHIKLLEIDVINNYSPG